jgi:hypothetical protein
MIDRQFFFDSVRKPLFGGALSQSQVDGLSAILTEWEAWAPENGDLSPNIRWLGNMLAQAYWETGKTMQPVREVGEGAGRDYGVPDLVTGLVYYGRGLIQLTWKANYQLMGSIVGAKLVENPDLALEPDLAARIMLEGMARGSFTGKRLGQYFGADPSKDDPYNARRIINGTDHAALITNYHRLFCIALNPPDAPVPTNTGSLVA